MNTEILLVLSGIVLTVLIRTVIDRSCARLIVFALSIAIGCLAYFVGFGMLDWLKAKELVFAPGMVFVLMILAGLLAMFLFTTSLVFDRDAQQL